MSKAGLPSRYSAKQLDRRAGDLDSPQVPASPMPTEAGIRLHAREHELAHMQGLSDA